MGLSGVSLYRKLAQVSFLHLWFRSLLPALPSAARELAWWCLQAMRLVAIRFGHALSNTGGCIAASCVVCDVKLKRCALAFHDPPGDRSTAPRERATLEVECKNARPSVRSAGKQNNLRLRLARGSFASVRPFIFSLLYTASKNESPHSPPLTPRVVANTTNPSHSKPCKALCAPAVLAPPLPEGRATSSPPCRHPAAPTRSAKQCQITGRAI